MLVHVVSFYSMSLTVVSMFYAIFCVFYMIFYVDSTSFYDIMSCSVLFYVVSM